MAFWVLGLDFRFPILGSGFAFWMLGLDFEFWMLSFGFWVSDLGVKNSSFRFCFSDFGCWVLDLGLVFWILDLTALIVHLTSRNI